MGWWWVPTTFRSTLPETNIAPQKWMVGILVSSWKGLFSVAMLVSGRVVGGSVDDFLGCFLGLNFEL